MNFNLIKIAAASALFATSMAQATVTSVVVDNFNTPDLVATDSTADGVAATASDAVRMLSVNVTATPGGRANAEAAIGANYAPPGYLAIANANGVVSTTTVSWNLASDLISSNAGNVAFYFDVISSDSLPIGLNFSLDGASLKSQTMAGGQTGTVTFDLDAAQIAKIAKGGKLAVSITGAQGFDAAFDTFGFKVTTPDPATVPEPGSLALVGLSLLAIGAARRARKA